MSRVAALAMGLGLSTTAVAAPDLSGVGSYSVVASSSVTLSAESVESTWECDLAQAFYSGAPWQGIQFRWDVNNDGTWDAGWWDTPTMPFSAAGWDGPATTSARLEAQCWMKSWWDLSGPWVASVSVMDVPISILNAPPTVSPIVAPGFDLAALSRAVPILFQVTAADPEAQDPLTVRWTWADGQVQVGNPVTRSFSATGPLGVTVLVSDGDGGTATTSTTVTVAGEAPVITSMDVAAQIPEGSTTTFTAVAADPFDPLTYRWEVSDGTVLSGPVVSWTPAADGAYTVTLLVSDGSSTVSQFAPIAVENLPPVITELVLPGALREGVGVSLLVRVTDPGGDPMRAAWDFGGGLGPPGPPGRLETTHAWPDDGSFPVTVVVTDDAGAASTWTVTASVLNVAPSASVNITSPVDEGQPVGLHATTFDVPADPVACTWTVHPQVLQGCDTEVLLGVGVHDVLLDLDDGDQGTWHGSYGVVVNNLPPALVDLDVPLRVLEGAPARLAATGSDPGGLVEISWVFGDGGAGVGSPVDHTWVDDGAYGALVVLSDPHAGVTVEPFTVLVENVDPVIDHVDVPVITEGRPATFTASVHDQGADSVDVRWYADGVLQGIGPSWTQTWPDDHTFVLTVEADDGDLGLATWSQTVVVANMAPAVDLIGDVDDHLSDTLSWTALVTDPGADSHVYAWDLGDGTYIPDGRPSVQHSYGSNGTYVVRVVVTDDDGGVSSDQLTVHISGVGPEISSFVLPTSADEGVAAQMSCTAIDPWGPFTPTYAWDFGDGQIGAGGVVSHAWPDDGDWYTTCKATDSTGQDTVIGGVVTVNNVPPVLSGSPPVVLVEGDTLTFRPTVVDPGADTFSFQLDGPPGAGVDATRGEVTWPTARGVAGWFDFDLTVRDDDGGTDTMSWRVNVVLRDDDQDGMSDYWEGDHGLDPSDPTDAADDTDSDGRTSLDEFLGDTDPGVDDRPPVPVLLYPVGGQEVPVPAPELVASAAPSPVGDVVVYDLRLYADAGGVVEVAAWDGVSTPPGTGPTAVTPILAENSHYWWTARARDPFAAGDWAIHAEFMVNAVQEPPSIPQLSWPADGTTIALTSPTLQWFASTDPDGDIVTHQLAVTDGAGTVLTSTAGIGGTGLLSWTVDRPVADGSAACWWVVAVDQHGLRSEASDVNCFVVDVNNLPPSEPEIVQPADGSTVTSETPDVVVVNGIDPEGRPTRLRYELDVSPTFDSAELSTDEVDADPSGGTTWAVGPLMEDRWYHLRVLASDGAAESAWVGVVFFVNAFNNPPGVPWLISPSDEATREDEPLVVGPTTDPEGGAVSYDIVVSDGRGVAAQAIGLLEVAGTVSWDPGRLAEGAYEWKARAVDEDGLPGAWTEPWTFSQAPDELVSSRSRPSPTIDDDLLPSGCGCGHGGRAWTGLGLVGLLLARRRR